jgi:hypothetical protein
MTPYLQLEVFSFLPVWLLELLHFASGLIVLIEALNKLERCCPLAKGLRAKARIAMCLKALAWLLLAMGAAGALVTPLLHLQPPTLQDVAVILGLAVLIVRSRLREFER